MEGSEGERGKKELTIIFLKFQLQSILSLKVIKRNIFKNSL